LPPRVLIKKNVNFKNPRVPCRNGFLNLVNQVGSRTENSDYSVKERALLNRI